MSGVVRKFQSDSRPGTYYEVSRAGDGTLYCNCPKWRFQKGVDPKERTCKHLKMFELEEALCGTLQAEVEQPVEVVVAKSKLDPKPAPKKRLRRGGTFWG